LEILAEVTGNGKECSAGGLPWYPTDAGQFEWALRTHRNWHPEDADTYLLAYPWPVPGEVPNIPGRYFIPTEKEKAKIQWFIDNFSGDEDLDKGTERASRPKKYLNVPGIVGNETASCQIPILPRLFNLIR
jgi:hypothetical protein